MIPSTATGKPEVASEKDGGPKLENLFHVCARGTTDAHAEAIAALSRAAELSPVVGDKAADALEEILAMLTEPVDEKKPKDVATPATKKAILAEIRRVKSALDDARRSDAASSIISYGEPGGSVVAATSTWSYPVDVTEKFAKWICDV